MKLRILRWIAFRTYLIQGTFNKVGPKCNHHSLYNREGEGDGHGQGEGTMTLEAEAGVMRPQAKECRRCLKLQEARHRLDGP